MHPSKVVRAQVRQLTDLPNVGRAVAADLRRIGINTPADLVDREALDLYRQLCVATGVRQDPCMLDTMMSITHFVAGGEPQPWWAFTAERQRRWPSPADQTGGVV